MGGIDVVHLLLLCGAWVVYFLIHSLLASLAFKRWVLAHRPAAAPVYRLIFNLSATLLLLPPLWLTYSDRGPWLWQWSGAWWWFANGAALIALGAIFWSLRWYDGSEFLGLSQWRRKSRGVEDQEAFHLSPLHRFVRHPWYSLGLVLVWTRDMDINLLVAAVLLSLYFVVGSRLEERKLIVYHGEIYRRYRQRVPGLVPLPWRWLRAGEAERLIGGTTEGGRGLPDG